MEWASILGRPTELVLQLQQQCTQQSRQRKRLESMHPCHWSSHSLPEEVRWHRDGLWVGRGNCVGDWGVSGWAGHNSASDNLHLPPNAQKADVDLSRPIGDHRMAEWVSISLFQAGLQDTDCISAMCPHRPAEDRIGPQLCETERTEPSSVYSFPFPLLFFFINTSVVSPFRQGPLHSFFVKHSVHGWLNIILIMIITVLYRSSPLYSAICVLLLLLLLLLLLYHHSLCWAGFILQFGRDSKDPRKCRDSLEWAFPWMGRCFFRLLGSAPIM